MKEVKAPLGVKIISILSYIMSILSLLVFLEIMVAYALTSGDPSNFIENLIYYVPLVFVVFFIYLGIILWKGKLLAKYLAIISALVILGFGYYLSTFNDYFDWRFSENMPNGIKFILFFIVNIVIILYLLFDKEAKNFFKN